MKVGIIGCGKIAQVRHLPEYADNKDVEIGGLFDFNMERAGELAAQFGGKAYASSEEMLADPEIDAVSICVANVAHAELSIKALNAGKHVLCEKPMAITLRECYDMVDAAKKSGRILMIGQNQRFTKAHQYAKKLIEDGAIGTPILFRTTFGHGGPETWSVDGGKNTWFFDKSKSSMGAMADLGIHKTDLIQYLLNDRIVETTAKVVTLDKRYEDGTLIGVDDNAVCIYRTRKGVLGTMTASWTLYGEEDNSTRICGTEGIMKIYENPAYSIEIVKRGGEKIFYELEAIQTNDNQTKSGIIDKFVEAVLSGQEPEASGENVLNAMKAVFASVESSETGRTVEIR